MSLFHIVLFSVYFELSTQMLYSFWAFSYCCLLCILTLVLYCSFRTLPWAGPELLLLIESLSPSWGFFWRLVASSHLWWKLEFFLFWLYLQCTWNVTMGWFWRINGVGRFFNHFLPKKRMNGMMHEKQRCCQRIWWLRTELHRKRMWISLQPQG